MANAISSLSGGMPAAALSQEDKAIANDSKMSPAQKGVVTHAADLLAEPGGYAKLDSADKTAVQAGDTAFNQSHGTHVDHTKSPVLLGNHQTIGTIVPGGSAAGGHLTGGTLVASGSVAAEAMAGEAAEAGAHVAGGINLGTTVTEK